VDCSNLDVTLPRDIIDKMDRMVEKGIYLNQGEIIREALRDLFLLHRIEPFYSELVEKVEKLED